MIELMKIVKYKKLEDLELSFSPNLNAISGTNGTCKTSLLYMISNSFQEVKTTNSNLKDNSVLSVIKKINDVYNPKIETITKGDKTYNDPAPGVEGVLYSITYSDGSSLGFRRHTSRKQSQHPRYSMKPQYKDGANESLPAIPVLYLGLSRLVSFGELDDNVKISNSSINLPDDYILELNNIYKELTRIEVSEVKVQSISGIKTRNDFSSSKDGVDSNTISAGEDNIRIILNALFSLKFYFENLTEGKDSAINSILIIDEFDATLHPSMQIKLKQVLRDFSENYKIQVFFTTHSLYLIENMINSKENVIYLLDQVDSVGKLESPDIYKIKMFLQSENSFDLYKNKCIPILTEDNEARIFLEIIFNHLKKIDVDGFGKVVSYFHMVQANIGSEVLEKMLEDKYLQKTTLSNVICIIDGDHDTNLGRNIIALPGKKNPEQLLFSYLENINDSFWREPIMIEHGFIKSYYIDNILPDITSIEESIIQTQNDGKSTKGMRREKQKDVFKKHIDFFSLVFSYWAQDTANHDEIKKFKKGLFSLFKKCSSVNGINPALWNKE